MKESLERGFKKVYKKNDNLHNGDLRVRKGEKGVTDIAGYIKKKKKEKKKESHEKE